jgi:hypothetical protein
LTPNLALPPPDQDQREQKARSASANGGAAHTGQIEEHADKDDDD